jgi:hypothetical protein
VPDYFSMTVQNIFAIDDVWQSSVTQSEKREKDNNKQEKGHLHAAENPTRFPSKRVNAFGPLLDKDQRNEKREDACM